MTQGDTRGSAESGPPGRAVPIGRVPGGVGVSGAPQVLPPRPTADTWGSGLSTFQGQLGASPKGHLCGDRQT